MRNPLQVKPALYFPSPIFKGYYNIFIMLAYLRNIALYGRQLQMLGNRARCLCRFY